MEDDTKQMEDKPIEEKSSMVFIVVVFALVALVGVLGSQKLFPQTRMMEKSLEVTPTATVTTTPAMELKSIGMAEIVKHTAKTDCWFAVEGRVYDVTKYIASGMHKGGEALLAGCGKDATELFNTRPMGSGTPHSDKARGYIANFQIGTLAQ